MHVVMVGVEPLALYRHRNLVVVDPRSAEQPLVAVADVVRSSLEHGPVLVVHPSWEPALGEVVDGVHSSLDQDHVLRHATPLPPLAAGVLGTLAMHLAPLLPDAGVLHAGLPLVEDLIRTGAVLGTVARLEHLGASVGQHLASWLPNGRFVATVGDDPPVRRLKRGQRLELPELGADERLFLAIGQTELGGPVRRSMQPVQEPTDESWSLELPLGSAAWWGTSDLVEFAMVPRDLDDIASRITSRVEASRDCSWCRRPSADATCPWCGHVRADTSAAA